MCQLIVTPIVSLGIRAPYNTGGGVQGVPGGGGGTARDRDRSRPWERNARTRFGVYQRHVGDGYPPVATSTAAVSDGETIIRSGKRSYMRVLSTR